MTSRRSFFSRVAQAAAIVALAPQLAFRTKGPEVLTYRSNSTGIYEQLRQCERVVDAGPLDLDDLFKTLYAIKKERGPQKHIEVWYPNTPENRAFYENFFGTLANHSPRPGYAEWDATVERMLT